VKVELRYVTLAAKKTKKEKAIIQFQENIINCFAFRVWFDRFVLKDASHLLVIETNTILEK